MRETLLKLHKHFKDLIENDVSTGNPVRNELVKADALRNLKDLETKHPFLTEVKEVKEKKSKEK